MDLNNKKIRAIFILETIGHPPEYLTEALNGIIKSMGEEKGVKLIESKVNPPVQMKNQKDFFTSFAEIEVELDQVLNIAVLMFKYMPAHVEIISPEHLSISNSEMGDLFSELTRRLHGYEEIARIMQNEKLILETKLRELLAVKEANKKEDGKQEVSHLNKKDVQEKKEKKKKK